MDYDCSNGAFSAAWRAVGALEGELEKLMGPMEAGQALASRKSRQEIDFRVVPKGEKHQTFEMVHIDRKPMRPFQPCTRGRGQPDGTKISAKKPTALMHPRPWGASDRQCSAQKCPAKPVSVERPPEVKPDCLARGIAVAEVSSDFLDLCVEAMSRWVVLDALEALPLRVDASCLRHEESKTSGPSNEPTAEHTVQEDTPYADASLLAIIQQLDETCLSLSHSFDLENDSDRQCDSPTKEEVMRLDTGLRKEPVAVRDDLETLVKAETECSMKVDHSSVRTKMKSPRRVTGRSKTLALPPPLVPSESPSSPSRSAVDRLYRGESSLSSSRSMKGSRKGPTSSRNLRSVSSPTDQSLFAESSVDSSFSVRSPAGRKKNATGSPARVKSPSSNSVKQQDEHRDSFVTAVSYNSADFVSMSSGPHEKMSPREEASNDPVLYTSAYSQVSVNCDGTRERQSTGPSTVESGRGKVREFGTGGSGRKYGSSGRFSIRSERQKSKHRISRPAVRAVRGWSLELARSASDVTASAHEGPIVPVGLNSGGPNDSSVAESNPSEVNGVSQLDLEFVVEEKPEGGIPSVTASDMKSPGDVEVEVHGGGGSDVELSLSPSPRVRCSSPVLVVNNPVLAQLQSSPTRTSTEPVTGPESVEPRRAPRVGVESDSVSIMSSCSSSFFPKEQRPPLPSSRSIAGEERINGVAAGSPIEEGSVLSVIRNEGDREDSSSMMDEAAPRLPTRTARSIRMRSNGPSLDASSSSSPPPPPVRRRSPFSRSSMARSSSDSTFEQLRVTTENTHVTPPQETASTPTKSGRRWLDKASISDAALQSLSGMSPDEPSRYSDDRVSQEHSYWSARPRQISRPIGSPASAPAEILLPLHRECERIATGRVCKNRRCDACAVYEDLMRSSLAVAARARRAGSGLRGKFSVMSVEEDEGDDELIVFAPGRPRGVGKRSVSSEGPALVDGSMSDAMDHVMIKAPVCEAEGANKSPDDKTSEETPLTPNSVWNIGSSPRAATVSHSSQDEEPAGAEVDSPASFEVSGSQKEASPKPVSAIAASDGNVIAVNRSEASQTVQEERLPDDKSVSGQMEVLNGLPGHGSNPSTICDSRRCVLEDSSFARRLKMSSHRFRKKKSRGFSDDPEEGPLAPEQTAQDSPRSDNGSEGTAEPVLVPLENSFIDSSCEEGPGDPERTESSHGMATSAEMLPPLGARTAPAERLAVERRVIVGEHFAPMPQRVTLQRRGFIRQAPHLPAMVLRERPQLM